MYYIIGPIHVLYIIVAKITQLYVYKTVIIKVKYCKLSIILCLKLYKYMNINLFIVLSGILI